VSIATRFPAAVDTIVVGAGTAGAAVAGRLAAGSSERTLLLEAGPDYGPADSGRWPHDLLDATSSPLWSHGIPAAEDFNDLDENAGVGQRLAEIGASRVVLSAGAYGSPAILLRSGIGPADELIAIGLKPALDLPGVGRNLHDQTCLEVWYEGSDELIERMERHQAETGWLPNEQVIAKFPSAGCRPGFDLHIYPVGGYSKEASTWLWFLGAACLTPLSRGSVRLSGPGPDDKLMIDHRYLSDPGGYDRARLAEGVERIREVAAAPELRRLLGRETRPGPEVSGRQAIERFLDHAAVHYYHPAVSCKMGPASDPDSVVDADAGCHFRQYQHADRGHWRADRPVAARSGGSGVRVLVTSDVAGSSSGTMRRTDALVTVVA
jgi:choline dehydrogenase-like flavoprotein